ncbi:MAG: DUF445 domain-containing protein [Frankiaceae bacterium]
MRVTTEAERQQRTALRRMKLLAGGLLLVAAGCYALTHRAGGGGWLGYVNAAAEAGTVGALADWFAVTALFRHPLGLPIPHTALIPARKDALGRSLEQFVASNFLAEGLVRERVRTGRPAAVVGRWLRMPANAERVASELAVAAGGAVAVLDDETVQQVLEQTVLRRVVELPWGPPAGRLLGRLVTEGAHVPLVDLVARKACDWLAGHHEAVAAAVQDHAPSWSPRWVDARVGHRIHAELLALARDVRDQPDHRVRLALDHFLLRLAKDLRDDPVTIERMELAKHRLLAQPAVRSATGALWTVGKRLVLEAVADPRSELRLRATAGLARLGEQLAEDSAVAAKVDGWVEAAAAHVVTTYRDQVTGIIGDTVGRWDGQETARRIELQVGRDLQFIRINGTVVGALAGLAIHAATALA